MSYNITSWKTKKLDGFKIPTDYYLSCLRACSGHPEGSIMGIPGHGGFLEVSKISMYGEGSGTFYDEVLVPTLERSIGILEAVLVWEDEIKILKVRDGRVEEVLCES